MRKLPIFTSNVIKQKESKKKLLNFISRIILIVVFCGMSFSAYSQNRSEKKYVSDSILVHVIQRSCLNFSIFYEIFPKSVIFKQSNI